MKAIKKYDFENKKGIILNANESFYPMEESMLQKVSVALREISFERYPENSSRLLCEAYAKYCEVKPSQIMAGNGSDELLGLIISLYIKKDKALLTLSPDFSMYDYYVSMNDGEMMRYPWGIEDDFNIDQFIAMAKQEQVSIILFSNPNNPTGRIISESNLLKLVQQVQDKIIVIDEAYFEFYGSSMVKYVEKYPNLYVTRTLSKAFGLAGIRCGFLITSEENMKHLTMYKVPYNVSSVTQCIATLVLQDEDNNKRKINSIIMHRDAMYNEYTKLNTKRIKLYPSSANYFYGKSCIKEKLLSALEEKQVHIRNYVDGYFRISVGNQQQNKLIINLIKELEECL